MLIEGTKILALPREAVWRALNDPAVLQASIPGCRSVAETEPGRLAIDLTAAVGPIKASFAVEVDKRDVVPLESYVLVGQGSAGVAGAASGRAQLRLSQVEGGTRLDYSAETEITGRVAQLGARMIDSTARKFSEAFFANLVRQLAPPATGVTDASSATTASRSGASPGMPGTQAPDRPPAVIGAAALAVPGLAWRLALGCAAGSFLGTAAAVLALRAFA